MYDGWEWQTCIAPGGKVQRDMRTWASSKSFSQGFSPCHSTDTASGTLSAVAANGATKVVMPRKTNENHLISPPTVMVALSDCRASLIGPSPTPAHVPHATTAA